MTNDLTINVSRFLSDNDTTLSNVAIAGGFVCFGCEDEHRSVKVAGETRIQEGTYKLGIRDVGGFHGRYKNKFPRMHKGMIQILDVPNFDYVLIHIGNDDDDTAGCLLVGRNCVTSPGAFSVGNSTGAYIELYNRVIDEVSAGNATITFEDNDRG